MTSPLKLAKTTFQDDLEFRFDLLGGELLTKVVREFRKSLPGVTQDDKSKAWVWKGRGVAEDPWYWVKITATDIVSFSGFYTGDENWRKFRTDVRKALVESLGNTEVAFVANLTTTYGWVVPSDGVAQKVPDLMRFVHLFLADSPREIERFSALVSDPQSQQRVLLEGIDSEDGFRVTLNVQSNRLEKPSLGELLDGHFAAADAVYARANAQVEKLFA